MRIPLASFILLLACGANAAPQDWSTLRQEAEQQIRRQMAGQTLVLRWETADMPVLPTCSKFEYEWPSSPRGKVFVTARCLDGQRWSARLPLWLSPVAPLAFASRALPREHVLTESDVEWRTVELAQYPQDSASEASQLVGRVLKQGLKAEQPVRLALLRTAFAVRRQQQVRLRAVMPGFTINSEGVAQNDAGAGERVRVRTPGGQLVEGVARDGGIVEVIP